MSASKPNNSERNARILDLARQGQGQAEIARALGISRGVVNGVVRRARDARTLAKAEPSKAVEGGQPGTSQSIGEEVPRTAPV